MSVFMFLFLPLMLCLYCFCYRENKNLPVICMGIMSAVIVCAIRMIFFYPHRIVPFSFTGNFFYLLVKEYFLPAVILYIVFFIFYRKSFECKIDSIFPLEISFYIVYLPYSLINSSSGFLEPFSLILKPLFYVAMFASVGIFAREIFRLSKNKDKIWLIAVYSILILFYMIFPAAVESLYLMNTNLLISVILLLFYSAYPFVYASVKIGKKLSNNDSSSVSYSFSETSENNISSSFFDEFDKLD